MLNHNRSKGWRLLQRYPGYPHTEVTEVELFVDENLQVNDVLVEQNLSPLGSILLFVAGIQKKSNLVFGPLAEKKNFRFSQ